MGAIKPPQDVIKSLDDLAQSLEDAVGVPGLTKMFRNPDFFGADLLNLPLHSVEISDVVPEQVSTEFKSLLNQASENLIQSLPGANGHTRFATREGVGIQLVSRFSYSMLKGIVHHGVHMTNSQPMVKDKYPQFEHLALELEKLMIQENSKIMSGKAGDKAQGILPFLPKYGHIARNSDEARSLLLIQRPERVI